MSVTFDFPCLSDTCFIRIIPRFLCQYLSSILHCASNVRVWFPIYCIWSVARIARVMRVQVGRGRDSCRRKKCFAWVCAQNYSGARFIAPSWGTILGLNLVPSPAGDGGYDICGSFRNMTSRPWSKSCHCLGHIRVKGVPQFLSP